MKPEDRFSVLIRVGAKVGGLARAYLEADEPASRWIIRERPKDRADEEREVLRRRGAARARRHTQRLKRHQRRLLYMYIYF